MTYKDHIGQEIKIGDWCAMTQNNQVHVGKIVSMSSKGNPTICRDSVEEYVQDNITEWNKLSWEDAKKFIISKFPGHSGYIPRLSWCRDKKFVKINPTDKMLVGYDWKAENK